MVVVVVVIVVVVVMLVVVVVAVVVVSCMAFAEHRMLTLDHSGQLTTTWADKLSHLAAWPVVSIQHVFCSHCTLRVTCKHQMYGILAVLIIFGKSDWCSVP